MQAPLAFVVEICVKRGKDGYIFSYIQEYSVKNHIITNYKTKYFEN